MNNKERKFEFSKENIADINRSEEEILKKISDFDDELKNSPDITEKKVVIINAMKSALRWVIDDLWCKK